MGTKIYDKNGLYIKRVYDGSRGLGYVFSSDLAFLSKEELKELIDILQVKMLDIK